MLFRAFCGGEIPLWARLAAIISSRNCGIQLIPLSNGFGCHTIWTGNPICNATLESLFLLDTIVSFLVPFFCHNLSNVKWQRLLQSKRRDIGSRPRWRLLGEAPGLLRQGDSPPRQGRGGGGARSGVCGGGVLDLWCASKIRERERATLQLIPSYLLADADELLFREK
jgi:hypothetical protein